MYGRDVKYIKILVRKPEEGDRLEELTVIRRIILKWVLVK
jgi:hypothetical protein